MSLIGSGRSGVGVGGVSSTRRKRRGEPAGTERALPSRRPQRPAPRGALLLSSGETRERALLRTTEGRRGLPTLIPTYIPTYLHSSPLPTLHPSPTLPPTSAPVSPGTGEGGADRPRNLGQLLWGPIAQSGSLRGGRPTLTQRDVFIGGF